MLTKESIRYVRYIIESLDENGVYTFPQARTDRVARENCLLPTVQGKPGALEAIIQQNLKDLNLTLEKEGTVKEIQGLVFLSYYEPDASALGKKAEFYNAVAWNGSYVPKEVQRLVLGIQQDIDKYTGTGFSRAA